MKLSICKHCNEKFNIEDKPKGWMANHSRWCEKNPKKMIYLKKLSEIRSKAVSHASRLKAAKKIKQYHKEGVYDNAVKILKTYIGRKHTKESKAKMSTIALTKTHRRLRRKMIEYKGIMLDSTWELKLAKILDKIKIKWIRPDPIKWTDKKGITHNYFPDFFLPKYNLFLDPKNPYAIEVQKEKLDIILEKYRNIVIIRLADINEQFMSKLLASIV